MPAYAWLSTISAVEWVLIFGTLYLLISGYGWAGRLAYLIYKNDREAESWQYLGLIGMPAMLFGTILAYGLLTGGMP